MALRAISQDGARLDLLANGVWGGRYEKTFFDVRVFNLIALSNRGQTLAAAYRKHEHEKKRAYEQCIREVNTADKWDFHYSRTLCSYSGPTL